jgi:hypothetical protein
MKMYYKNSIDRLKYNSLDAKRNKTNNRLDTNLTNMASILVDEICLQNDLVQIDLSNSQFVLLTNLLQSHLSSSDYKLFKELSVSGKLYSYIASSLSLKSAKNGKSLMFEVMFSSRRNNSAYKKKIKELFPSVVGWIDDYKKALEAADELKVIADVTISVAYLENEISELEARLLFVKAVVSGRLVVANVEDDVLLTGLKDLGVPALSGAVDDLKGYEYLLRMRIDRLKAASVAELEREVTVSREKHAALTGTSCQALWLADLDAFATTWETYADERTTIYAAAAAESTGGGASEKKKPAAARKPRVPKSKA